ncbi:MAG: hypothetical protein ChlgKO_12350 [Chlamydiales bacterium]
MDLIWEASEIVAEEVIFPESSQIKRSVTVRSDEIPDHFYDGVQVLHEKGISVKCSIKAQMEDVEVFAEQAGELLRYYELDGVEVVFQEVISEELIYACQKVLGDKLSCAFSASLVEKYGKTIAKIEPYLSQIIVFDFLKKKCDFEEEMRRLWDLGVQGKKIVFSLQIGPHRGGRGVTTIADCKMAANVVKKYGLYGVQLDSFQRDTDCRGGVDPGPSAMQTGLPKGLFAQVVCKTLVGS